MGTMSTDERLVTGAKTQELQRTAPPIPEVCPTPAPEDSWRTTHVSGKRQTFATPQESLDAALAMIRHAETRRDRAVVQLAHDGWDDERIASAANLSVDQVARLVLDDRIDRDRLAYSAAYYLRHPDRIPGLWYPVQDKDPVPPRLPIGIRERTLSTSATQD